MKKRIRKQLVALVSAGAVLFSSIPAMAAGESNTAIIIGNAISEESAKECFERLTITLE